MDPSYNNDFGGNVGGNFDGFGMQNGMAGIQGGVRTDAPIISSSTGDIVLPKEKGGPKKGLIIGLLVAVVVLVGGGIAALLLIGGNGQTAITPFESLMVYMENGVGFDASAVDGEANTDDDGGTGDEAEENDVSGEQELADDANMMYAIKIIEENEATISRYYQGLVELLGAASGGVDAEVWARYMSNVAILRGIVNHAAIENELLGVLGDAGAEAADEYYLTTYACQSEGELDDICELMDLYYERFISEYAIYINAGCYSDGVYDAECAIEYYGQDTYMNDSNLSGVAAGYLSDLQAESVLRIVNARIKSQNLALVGNAS